MARDEYEDMTPAQQRAVDERDLKIIRMTIAGVNPHAISKRVGCSRGVVVNRIERFTDEGIL